VDVSIQAVSAAFITVLAPFLCSQFAYFTGKPSKINASGGSGTGRLATIHGFL
jgi:hypothetical protein